MLVRLKLKPQEEDGTTVLLGTIIIQDIRYWHSQDLAVVTMAGGWWWNNGGRRRNRYSVHVGYENLDSCY